MTDDQVFETVSTVVLGRQPLAEPHIVAWLHDCVWSNANRDRWQTHYARCASCRRWFAKDQRPDAAPARPLCGRCRGS